MKRCIKAICLAIIAVFMCQNVIMAETMKDYVLNYDYDTTAKNFNYDVAGTYIRIYGSSNLATLKRVWYDDDRGYVLSVTGNGDQLNTSNKGYTTAKPGGGYLKIGDEVTLEFDMMTETGGMVFSLGGSQSSSIGLFTPFYVPSGEIGDEVALKIRNQAEFVTTSSSFTDYGVKYKLGDWVHIRMVISEWASNYKANIKLYMTTADGETKESKNVSVSYYGSGAHAQSVFDEIRNITFRGLKEHKIYFDNIELYTIIPEPEVKGMTVIKYDGTEEETLDNASTLIKKIDVAFSMDMDVESLSDIKVMQGDNEISVTPSYNSANFIYTMEINSVLSTGTEYTVIVPKTVKNTYGLKAENEYSKSIVTQNEGDIYIISSIVKDGGYELKKSLLTSGSELEMEVKYIKTGDKKSGFTIGCCGYKNGEGGVGNSLKGMEYGNVQISEDETGVFTKTIPLSEDFVQKAVTSDYVKVFVFNGNNLKLYSLKKYN